MWSPCRQTTIGWFAASHHHLLCDKGTPTSFGWKPRVPFTLEIMVSTSKNVSPKWALKVGINSGHLSRRLKKKGRRPVSAVPLLLLTI